MSLKFEKFFYCLTYLENKKKLKRNNAANLFDNLPKEIWFKIFSMLTINERVKFRRLSKKYQFIIDNLFNIKEVVILSVLQRACYMPLWCDNDEKMNLSNVILMNRNLKLSSNFCFTKDPFFVNLKKLCIDFYDFSVKYPDYNRLNNLNNLKNLETLSIIGRTSYKITKLTLLHLKNLEMEMSDCKEIELITPKLEQLKVDNLEKFKIRYPLSIKKIYFSSKGILDEFHRYEKLKELKHLEFLNVLLNVAEPQYYSVFIELISNNFVNFKALSCRLYTSSLRYGSFYKILRKCLEHRKFKVYLSGLPLDRYREDLVTFKLENLDSRKFELFLEYYPSIADTLPHTCIDYSQAYENELLYNRVPKGFVSNLINLEMIIVDQRIRLKKKFIEFLTGCCQIKFLSLTNSALDQTFYSHLYVYLPVLMKLSIIEDDKQIFKHLNFDFLFLLNYLVSFKVNANLKLFNQNLVQDLYSKLNLLNIEYDTQAF